MTTHASNSAWKQKPEDLRWGLQSSSLFFSLFFALHSGSTQQGALIWLTHWLQCLVETDLLQAGQGKESSLKIAQSSDRVLLRAMCQHVAHGALGIHIAHVSKPLVVQHLLIPRLPLLVH